MQLKSFKQSSLALLAKAGSPWPCDETACLHAFCQVWWRRLDHPSGPGGDHSRELPSTRPRVACLPHMMYNGVRPGYRLKGCPSPWTVFCHAHTERQIPAQRRTSRPNLGVFLNRRRSSGGNIKAKGCGWILPFDSLSSHSC